MTRTTAISESPYCVFKIQIIQGLSCCTGSPNLSKSKMVCIPFIRPNALHFFFFFLWCPKRSLSIQINLSQYSCVKRSLVASSSHENLNYKTTTKLHVFKHAINPQKCFIFSYRPQNTFKQYLANPCRATPVLPAVFIGTPKLQRVNSFSV